jgi:hypothetical protein
LGVTQKPGLEFLNGDPVDYLERPLTYSGLGGEPRLLSGVI